MKTYNVVVQTKGPDMYAIAVEDPDGAVLSDLIKIRYNDSQTLPWAIRSFIQDRFKAGICHGDRHVGQAGIFSLHEFDFDEEVLMDKKYIAHTNCGEHFDDINIAYKHLSECAEGNDPEWYIESD